MRVIVSIHDVTPSRMAETRRLRALIARLHPGPVSLLVIPRNAGRESWRGDPGLEWLRERAERGDEIVLHGWSHVTADGRDGPETARMNRIELADRLEAGLAEFARLGLPAHGFVAPAYGRARGLDDACLRGRLRWWADRGRLRWHGGGRAVPSLGLGASRPLRRALSPAVASLAVQLVARMPTVRLDLHTADAHHRRLEAHGMALLARLIDQGRAPAVHADLVPNAGDTPRA